MVEPQGEWTLVNATSHGCGDDVGLYKERIHWQGLSCAFGVTVSPSV